MRENDLNLLGANGWAVECESPFEIRHEDGSFATGQAAKIVLDFLMENNDEEVCIEAEPQKPSGEEYEVEIPQAKELQDTDKMPFGKYGKSGTLMQDVPADYFHYLWTHGLEHDRVSPVAKYIRKNLNALKKEHRDGIW